MQYHIHTYNIQNLGRARSLLPRVRALGGGGGGGSSSCSSNSEQGLLGTQYSDYLLSGNKVPILTQKAVLAHELPHRLRGGLEGDAGDEDGKKKIKKNYYMCSFVLV